jgi:hypothetical protein
VETHELVKIIRAEWRALYGRLHTHSQGLRRQQWFVVVYCSLLFGGIVAFMHTQGLSRLGAGERWIIKTLSLCVLAAGVFLLSLLQYNLRNTQIRILEIENYFLVSRRYRARLNGWERMQHRGSATYLHQFPFYILFILALVMGFLFVHWYLRSPFLVNFYFRFIPHARVV